MADGGTKGEVFDITDMRAPVLTDMQKAALAGAVQASFDFSVEAILGAAKAQTGLSDFGAMDFIKRLELWCLCVKEDTFLSPISHAALWTMFLRYAADRLRVEDLCKRHPEILDIVIDRPIIVAGPPRSGTTHLLGLLSADQRLRSMPWWEATAPVYDGGHYGQLEVPQVFERDGQWFCTLQKIRDCLLPLVEDVGLRSRWFVSGVLLGVDVHEVEGAPAQLVLDGAKDVTCRGVL